MFAETSRQKDRGTNHRLAHQVYNILQENAYNTILHRLQRESQVHLDHDQRRHLLQQLRLQYGKRSYPEETYEDWISGKPAKHLHGTSKQLKRNEGNEPSKPEVLTSTSLHSQFRDFNDEVYDKLLQDLCKGQVHEEIEEKESAEIRAQARKASRDAQNTDSSESDSEINSRVMSRTAQKDAIEVSSEEVSENETSTEEEATATRALLKQWNTELNANRDLTRAIYIVSRRGLDPIAPSDPLSVKEQHIKSIRTLLHLAIMDRKWDLAYKLYSLLIKIQGIKKRLIWTLGAEILQGKLDEVRAGVSKNPSGGARAVRVQSKMLQDFLSWLSTSFSLAYWSIKANTKHGQPFIGYSKTHAPMYAVTLLWELLAEKSYSKVRDVLEELLLKPPFSTHGLFHYMLAVCCLSENIDLKHISQHFEEITEILDQDPTTSNYGDLVSDIGLLSSTDSIANRMRSNVSQAKRLLNECDVLGLEYPKESFLTMLLESVEEKSLNDAKPKQEKSANSLPETAHFALKDGSLMVTTNPNFSVPKHILDKFHGKKHSDLWVINFYSDSQPMSCKICNSHIEPKSVNDLQEHLLQDGINSDNYASHELYCAPMQRQTPYSDAWLESESDSFSESEKRNESTAETDSELNMDSQRDIEHANKTHPDQENRLPPSEIPGSKTSETQQLSIKESSYTRGLDEVAISHEAQAITNGPNESPMVESEEDAQIRHGQKTAYQDTDLSSDESSASSLAVKVEEHRSDGALTGLPEAGLRESSDSQHDRLRPLDSGKKTDVTKRVTQPSETETSFLARTRVFNSLFQDSDDTSESNDEINFQLTQHSESEISTDEFHSVLETASATPDSGSPRKPFNNFSPDSTFENPDYERDISQNFHELATQTHHHNYFPESKNWQDTRSHQDNLLDTDTSHLPEVPEIKKESNLDFGKSEANIFRAGEKDTWSDEYEEVSEDERQWWETYANPRVARDTVSGGSKGRNDIDDQSEEDSSG